MNPELLEAQSARVLPSRDTMSVVFLNAFVFAPSRSVIILNNVNHSNAVSIAGASISITQVATG